MSKPALGLLLGGLLGLIDGLSALLHPGTGAMIVPIVVGSTIKGLVLPGAILGAIVGFATQRFGR